MPDIVKASVERSINSNAHKLRALYVYLSSINDINTILNNPLSSSAIQQSLMLLNSFNIDDIGINEDILLRLTHSVSMSVCTTAKFEIVIFFLPAGSHIPLHDHPNMAVLTKIIHGELAIHSFTPLNSISSSGSMQARRDGVARKSTVNEPWILTATEGNIHEFFALSACVLVDVLLPPYSDEDKRPCLFYQADKSETEGLWDLQVVDINDDVLPVSVEYDGPVL